MVPGVRRGVLAVPRRLHPIVRLNKDVAEYFAGHSAGRPTISRRTGRIMSDVTGLHEDTCVDLFHLALGVAAIAVVKSTVAPKQSTGR